MVKLLKSLCIWNSFLLQWSKNQRMVEHARKAMISFLRKSRKLQLPLDLQLQLFDSMKYKLKPKDSFDSKLFVTIATVLVK